MSDPFASVTLESNPLHPRQVVSQSPMHSHPRLLSKSLSLVFLPLMMLKGGKKLVSSTERNTWGGLYCTNLVLPLQLIAGSQKLFYQNDCDQHTAVHQFHRFFTDFSLLVKLHKYICHFCSNGVNLHTYLLNLKAKFSWCVELILPPTRCKSATACRPNFTEPHNIIIFWCGLYAP